MSNKTAGQIVYESYLNNFLGTTKPFLPFYQLDAKTKINWAKMEKDLLLDKSNRDEQSDDSSGVYTGEKE